MFVLDTTTPFAVFDNNFDPDGDVVVLHELAFRIEAHDEAELIQSFVSLDEAAKQGLWVAVAVSYECGYALEPRFKHLFPDTPLTLLKAWVFRQRTTVAAAAREAWWQHTLGSLAPQEQEAGILDLKPAWDETLYRAAVHRILTLIEAGDCYQVNLTFRLDGVTHGHPLALFGRLRETQPVSYGTVIHDEGNWILSRSPELFFSRHGKQLLAKPMKGTAARTGNEKEDAQRQERLFSSAKDRAENLMIVDLIRNDLGKLVPPGGVTVPRLFELEAFKTVYQLTSTVSASPVTVSTSDVFRALFPCGSITGAPKIRAMEIIRDLESGPRGLYCGALGWMSPTGDQRFSVPIRTLLVSPDRRCRLDVGSGVVADSNPSSEYQECLAKAAFVQQLQQDFGLIETMRWAPETGIELLYLHMNRLETSALALGFRFDLARIRAAVADAVESLQDHPHRVRLILSRDGSVKVAVGQVAPIQENARVCIATTALDGWDPKLRFKTTARVFYDKALEAAIHKGFFDVLFFNGKGELCEGARTNIFLEKNGVLLTPALASGLLPGVFRQHLLEAGKVRESVLTHVDLRDADRVFVGNALRGLIPVEVQAER